MADVRSELSEAAQRGDLARLRQLLDGNRDFATMPDLEGYTPLHYAAYFGHADVARYLIGIGADLEAVSMDPLRNRPLHAAASSGHAVVAQQLLGAGADPNALQTGEWTPLHAAAERGSVELVQMLLAAGADPRRRSASGATPRTLAEARGHTAVVGLLPAEPPA
jgi:uncharacterized protein